MVAVEIDQSIISSNFLITNNCYLSPINKAIDNAYRILNRSKRKREKTRIMINVVHDDVTKRKFKRDRALSESIRNHPEIISNAQCN